MDRLPLIEVGFQVYVSDGGDAVGAVRQVRVVEDEPPLLEINIEGGGDFRVPLEAVQKVVAQRVVLRFGALEPALQRALQHTQDAEDPEAVQVRSDDDSEQQLDDRLDEEDASQYESPPIGYPR